MSELPCGKLLGIPNAEYQAADAVTSTKLRTFLSNKRRYYLRYVAKTLAGKSGYSLDFGQAFHSLMESEAAFNAITVSSPFKDFRTDEAKAWKKEVTKTKLIIEADERAALHAMKASALAHPEAKILLANTEAEVTWRAKLGQFYVQARTDRWSETGCDLTDGLPYLIDFKSIDPDQDLSLEEDFEKEASNRDYHIQVSWYQEVIATVRAMLRDEPRPRAFLICTETKPPHETQVREWTLDDLVVAKATVLAGIREMRQCYATNTWPGAATGIIPLRLKPWKINAAAQQIQESQQAKLT